MVVILPPLPISCQVDFRVISEAFRKGCCPVSRHVLFLAQGSGTTILVTCTCKRLVRVGPGVAVSVEPTYRGESEFRTPAPKRL